MKRVLRVLLAAALPLAATPVTARADQPRFVPTRDVSVTYATAGSETALPPRVVMRYFAVGNKFRIDGNQGPYLVLDRTMKRVEMVLPDAKLAMELPPGVGISKSFLLGDGLNFRRTGSASVLGRTCTIYEVTLETHHASACISADGLVLRGEGSDPAGRRTRIEAVAVNFGPQPPGMFAPPDTYRYVTLPR